MSQDNYNELVKLSKEISTLSSIHALLDWDQETYMPEKGIALRSSQKQLLSSLIHEKKKSHEFKKQLSKLIDLKTGQIIDPNLEDLQKRSLLRILHDFNIAKKQSDELVKNLSEATSTACHVWSKTKKTSDFQTFAPYLKRVFDKTKEQAEALGYQDHPYDALLDLYEPGMTVEVLDPLFKELKKALIPLIQKQPPKPDTSFFYGNFDKEVQRKFCIEILETLGFDFTRGRLDRTSHPFCMGLSSNDLRLTIHGESGNLIGNIMATLHEGGHALYEQGLLEENFGTPLGMAASLGIHESQSRFYETRIGLSKPFWTHTYPLLQKTYPHNLEKVSFDTFYKALTASSPSLIRVHSDELTYSLHIILRYEIEKAYLEGEIAIKDLPNIFAEKMQESLGISPNTHAEGVMQDIHWSMGLIGYFPTYTLGNIYSAQIFNQFKLNHPDWEKRVENGHLHFIRDYLNEKIHKYGRAFLPQELIENLTKEKLNAKPYIDYLKEKFT
ncbi:MAG: carboxypeptidase M32 [Simkaniaceae bacterium]